MLSNIIQQLSLVTGRFHWCYVIFGPEKNKNNFIANIVLVNLNELYMNCIELPKLFAQTSRASLKIHVLHCIQTTNKLMSFIF